MLLFKWFNLVLCLASLATAGLGESNPGAVLERFSEVFLI
jgi:hypothetical protein